SADFAMARPATARQAAWARDDAVERPRTVTDPADETPAVRLGRERDLYRRLLALGTRDSIESFLEEALALVCEVAGADRGYVELVDPEAGVEPRSWNASLSLEGDEVGRVRTALAGGALAEAVS